MKKRIKAFYDCLVASIITLLCIVVVIKISSLGYLRKGVFTKDSWWILPLAFFCVVVPAGVLPFFVQYLEFDFDCGVLHINNLRVDNHNRHILFEEVDSVEVVKLTRKEKRQKPYTRFLFSKFLLVTLKNGDIKYIYVSHYSKKQILKITELLLIHKTRQ